MKQSFWWWQRSVRYSYSLPLAPPPGIFVPASISSGDSDINKFSQPNQMGTAAVDRKGWTFFLSFFLLFFKDAMVTTAYECSWDVRQSTVVPTRLVRKPTSLLRLREQNGRHAHAAALYCHRHGVMFVSIVRAFVFARAAWKQSLPSRWRVAHSYRGSSLCLTVCLSRCRCGWIKIGSN